MIEIYGLYEYRLMHVKYRSNNRNLHKHIMQLIIKS